MSPLLTIGIPTYNRAALLSEALDVLLPQAREFAGLIEVVVSDNASSDETPRILERAKEQAPLVTSRNATNVGPILNVRMITDHLAHGEHCWVLGDDDRVRAGGVRAVVQILQAHPEVDFLYVNYLPGDFRCFADIRERTEAVPPGTRAGSAELMERPVAQWDELLAMDENCMTPIYAAVFRRRLWLEAARGVVPGRPFSSAQNTYPHACIFARAMKGRHAWTTGYPWVVTGTTREMTWREYVPVVVLLRFPEYLTFLEELGVDPRYLVAHRKRLMSVSAEFLIRVLSEPPLPELGDFSFLRYLRRYGRYREGRSGVWRALASTPLRTILRHRPACAPAAAAVKLLNKALLKT